MRAAHLIAEHDDHDFYYLWIFASGTRNLILIGKKGT